MLEIQGRPRVVIVGAGLSGISAGYRLHEAGCEVIVLERDAEVGGSARTERHSSYLVDTGPDLLNTSYSRYLALANEVGLGPSIVRSSQVIDVIGGGRPISFDAANRLSLLRSPLLTKRGRAALARGYLRTRRRVKNLDPYALTSAESETDRPAAEFSRDTFGAEVSAQFIDPIVRAFAGTGLEHTSSLSVLGALTVGGSEMVSVEGGLAAVPKAAASALDTRRGVTVTRIEDSADGVVVSTEDEEIVADACVLAVMYDEAAEIWPALEEADPGFGETLRPVPLLSISLGYDRRATTEAYSVLVPTREHSDVLLMFHQQNKAPDRVPDGHSLITLFTEAMATPSHLGRSDEEIVGWADSVVAAWYPELANRRDFGVVTRWPRTGYVPTPGFFERVRALRQALPSERVHATSALFGSGSVERAVLGGERAARRVHAALASVPA